MLGKEFDPPSSVLESEKNPAWPIPDDSPLAQMLTTEALTTWDYNLFKLFELSGGHPLVYLAHGIIRLFELDVKLDLDQDVLHRSHPCCGLHVGSTLGLALRSEGNYHASLR